MMNTGLSKIGGDEEDITINTVWMLDWTLKWQRDLWGGD